MNGYVNVPGDQLLHRNSVLSKLGKKKWIRCALFSGIRCAYHTCIPTRSRILGNSGESCQKAKGLYKQHFWKWGRKVCGWGRVLQECCLFLGGYRVEVQKRGREDISGQFMPLRVTLRLPVLQLRSTGRMKADRLPGQTEKSQLAPSCASCRPGHQPSPHTSSLADKASVWIPLSMWAPVNPIEAPAPRVGIKFPVRALRLRT